MVKADSDKTVQEQQAQANTILAGLKLQEAMCNRVEQYTKKRGRPMFVKLSDEGPTLPDEETIYQSLLPKKIDNVLEISITSLGMQTSDKWDFDPSLAVFITARARLVQTRNNTVSQDRPYIFESETRTFFEWIAEIGRLTAESLTQGYQKIAEQIFYSAF